MTSTKRSGITFAKLLWVPAISLLLAPASVWAQSETVIYYHTDAIGSVRATSDENGDLIERFDYLPFGELCEAACSTSPTPDKRQYAGKERESETGLDYFGARYYRAQSGRFTTIDPVMNFDAALTDPQRWNRYSYSSNNPFSFVDPDGRDVKYANSQLKNLFDQMAARSAMVRGTLELYTGAGKPDLLIMQGDAGTDLDGKSKASGSFESKNLKFDVSYAGREQQLLPGLTAEQIENLGTWTTTGQATLTLDNSLSISFQSKTTVETATHELGHADEAARSPLQFLRDSKNVYLPNGRLMSHDDRPLERFANDYLARALREVWR